MYILYEETGIFINGRNCKLGRVILGFSVINDRNDVTGSCFGDINKSEFSLFLTLCTYLWSRTVYIYINTTCIIYHISHAGIHIMLYAEKQISCFLGYIPNYLFYWNTQLFFKQRGTKSIRLNGYTQLWVLQIPSYKIQTPNKFNFQW